MSDRPDRPRQDKFVDAESPFGPTRPAATGPADQAPPPPEEPGGGASAGNDGTFWDDLDRLLDEATGEGDSED